MDLRWKSLPSTIYSKLNLDLKGKTKKILESGYRNTVLIHVVIFASSFRKQGKNNQPEDLAKVWSLTDAHRNEYSEARIEVNRQMDLALSQPKTWFGMQIDDMDNSKSYLPKLTENYKSLVSTTRLKTKITGCIIVSSLYENNRKCHFFTNHDQFENGSNKVKV